MTEASERASPSVESEVPVEAAAVEEQVHQSSHTLCLVAAAGLR